MTSILFCHSFSICSSHIVVTPSFRCCQSSIHTSMVRRISYAPFGWRIMSNAHSRQLYRPFNSISKRLDVCFLVNCSRLENLNSKITALAATTTLAAAHHCNPANNPPVFVIVECIATAGRCNAHLESSHTRVLPSRPLGSESIS